MVNTRLIIFEGIPGSGKTTTSQLLYKYLIDKQLSSNVYIEGCQHPIDLPFYAYLSLREYDNLLLNYKEQATWLKQNSMVEDDYVLTTYKVPEPNPYDETLINYLSSKELCYSNKPIVSFEIFKKVFYRRFEQFVSKVRTNNEITIFESVLFQHQIHDINRLYPYVSDDEIVEHLKMLADILVPLDPVLFYISQNSVRESLQRTASIRCKPKWSTGETISYYEKRKALELKAIKAIPIHSFILDNKNYDWDGMFNGILNILSKV